VLPGVAVGLRVSLGLALLGRVAQLADLAEVDLDAAAAVGVTRAAQLEHGVVGVALDHDGLDVGDAVDVGADLRAAAEDVHPRAVAVRRPARSAA
jgi:hypothetical protein